ncbi:MAG: hypothetical protein AB1521_13710 [Bacteroidota bacterium]
MKNDHIKILLTWLLGFCLVILSGCKPIDTEVDDSQKYFISLGEFTTYDEADAFKSKIDFELWCELKIKQIEEKRFVLLYGSFNSSFDAGEKGFELYSNSLVSNYKILKENNYIRDDFSNFVFIGKYQGRQSIFNYNLVSQKTKQVWSRWGRKVVTLNHAFDRGEIFFTTALGFGKQGTFPYIRDARLYTYRSANDVFEEIEEFGTGLQIYTYWENTDTFKVNFTQPDSIDSNIIVQEIFPYDLSGKRGTGFTRRFNLAGEGFPKPPQIKPEYFSPSAKRQIREVIQDGESFLYLRDIDKNSELLVYQSNGKLQDIRWTKNSNFAVCSLINPKSNKGFELIVIDCSSNKNAKTFYSSEYINSLVHGNLLFFEEKSVYGSVISIYNFEKDTIINKISMPGGCAIFNLK